MRAAALRVEDTALGGPVLRVVRDTDHQRFDREEPCSPELGTMLVQNRQQYDPAKITALAESMKRRGLINAPEQAALTAEEARTYLRVWNRVWGRRYTLSHLHTRDGYYLIVVNGHCRTLAGRQHLREEGRAPARWRVKFLYGVTAEEALDRQFQENIHSTPETWEDAEAVYRYWAFLNAGKDKTDRISIAEFAGKVGRSESAVRDYIKFGDAPSVIQEAVRSNRIGYGKGLLIARAVEAGALTEMGQIESEIINASLPGITNKAFENGLLGRIAKASQGQDDLFGDLDAATVAQALTDERRAVVLPQLLRRVRENGNFFGAALDLAERGHLGPEHPYSGASVGRALLQEVEILRQLLPHLRAEVAAKRAVEADLVLEEALGLLAELHGDPIPDQEPLLAA